VHPSSSKGKPAPLQLEAKIRDRGLKGAKKQDVRLTQSQALGRGVLHLGGRHGADTGLLPSNPMSKAVAGTQGKPQIAVPANLAGAGR